MSIFEHKDFVGHEGVHFFEDQASGLKAVVAVHSTKRGPAAGGTRFWTYASSAEALTDALRLSRAMSFKNAMADLPLGGGKGVVMHPEGDFDRRALFLAYGRGLNGLAGRYVTAEDVGMTPNDLKIIREETPYAAGLDDGPAASGDPSPITAKGVFYGLQTAAQYTFGTSDLKGRRVAVQGLGHVGYNVCKHLHKAGAELWVADISEQRVHDVVNAFGATVIPTQEIHACNVDIFAPCALGGAINAQTLPDIQAKIIGGAANNQLEQPEFGDRLRVKEILYCPDYVINAGGIINVASEISGNFDPNWVEGKLLGLKDTLHAIFKRSERESRATSEIADEMAQERITGASFS